MARDPNLPPNVFQHGNRYRLSVREGGKQRWVSLSAVRDGYPGVWLAYQTATGEIYIPPAPSSIQSARRQLAERQRTPGWADHGAIEAVYEEARRRTAETGVVHHVDHEIPLRGRFVSGLHVHTNLRVIPAVENGRKGNRFEPC